MHLATQRANHGGRPASMAWQPRPRTSPRGKPGVTFLFADRTRYWDWCQQRALIIPMRTRQCSRVARAPGVLVWSASEFSLPFFLLRELMFGAWDDCVGKWRWWRRTKHGEAFGRRSHFACPAFARVGPRHGLGMLGQ